MGFKDVLIKYTELYFDEIKNSVCSDNDTCLTKDEFIAEIRRRNIPNIMSNLEYAIIKNMLYKVNKELAICINRKYSNVLYSEISNYSQMLSLCSSIYKSKDNNTMDEKYVYNWIFSNLELELDSITPEYYTEDVSEYYNIFSKDFKYSEDMYIFYLYYRFKTKIHNNYVSIYNELTDYNYFYLGDYIYDSLPEYLEDYYSKSDEDFNTYVDIMFGGYKNLIKLLYSYYSKSHIKDNSDVFSNIISTLALIYMLRINYPFETGLYSLDEISYEIPKLISKDICITQETLKDLNILDDDGLKELIEKVNSETKIYDKTIEYIDNLTKFIEELDNKFANKKLKTHMDNISFEEELMVIESIDYIANKHMHSVLENKNNIFIKESNYIKDIENKIFEIIGEYEKLLNNEYLLNMKGSCLYEVIVKAIKQRKEFMYKYSKLFDKIYKLYSDIVYTL